MTSRRNFLSTVAAGLGVAAVRPSLAAAAATPEIKTGLPGPVGLQLWSLRNYLPKDVPGTLARVRDLGIRHVEAAGIPKGVASAADFRKALDKADLVCSAGHVGFAQFRDDAAGAVAELKTLGAKYAVCPWIDHDNKAGFNLEGAVKAASVFNAAGQAAAKEGLKFAYHCHGYEFVPSPDGTLFDTIVKNTDPALVGFEIDLFWAKAGGVDPARLIASLPGRVPLMHIKDMKKDLALPAGSSGAPEDSDVAAGTGQLDFPAIFKAAIASKMEYYFIEDESTKPWDQLPVTLGYLKALKL